MTTSILKPANMSPSEAERYYSAAIEDYELARGFSLHGDIGHEITLKQIMFCDVPVLGVFLDSSIEGIWCIKLGPYIARHGDEPMVMGFDPKEAVFVLDYVMNTNETF